jgi:hypothetical protein
VRARRCTRPISKFSLLSARSSPQGAPSPDLYCRLHKYQAAADAGASIQGPPKFYNPRTNAY